LKHKLRNFSWLKQGSNLRTREAGPSSSAAAAQQKQEDPIIQMQQAELQIKQGELQRKAAERCKRMGQLEPRKTYSFDRQKKLQTTASLEASRIASQNDQAQAKNDLGEAKAMMDAAKIRLENERNN
jgi:hypothetical protein